MERIAHRLQSSRRGGAAGRDGEPVGDASALSIAELERGIDDWLLDCEYRQLSPSTLYARRFITGKLLWFLKDRECDSCGKREIKQFIGYLGRGHEDERGRFGSDHARSNKPPSRSTISTYFTAIRTLFAFLVAEGFLDVSPMEDLGAPIARPDQIQPFTLDQVESLLTAAQRTDYPRRNKAILLVLLDTGVRASELCGLKMRDVDLHGRRATVLGKGDKRRTIYLQPATVRAIIQYIREDGEREPHEALFRSERGHAVGSSLTRSGLRQLISKLGKAAGIEAARCSPHTFRHTFAVMFLRGDGKHGGGNVFTLKELLGHTSLTICQRYVALAQADLENQHRQYSPVNNLKRV